MGVRCGPHSPALHPSLRFRPSEPEDARVVDMPPRPVLDCLDPMRTDLMRGREKERGGMETQIALTFFFPRDPSYRLAKER